MSPPPGFEQWANMAIESNSPIIDNFDTIMQSLEPFWGITAKEMRARLDDMRGRSPLGVFSVKNHNVSMTENTLVLGGFDTTITRWIERFKHTLPDMDVVINGLAEPRVIVPHDRLSHLVQTCPSETELQLDTHTNQERLSLEWQDLGRQSNWQMGVRSCPESSISRSMIFAKDNHTHTLPFITNHTAEKDWCTQPEASYSHSMFVAPYNLKITNTLVPIFSHGKPSVAQDILYPSPDYDTTSTPSRYTEALDPTWDEKLPTLYWAGSDTGGFSSTPTDWQKFQRQRFVSLMTNISKPITLLHSTKPSPHSPHNWTPYLTTLSASNLSTHINVGFTSFAMCTPSACVAQASSLPSHPRDDGAEMYKHRFLFDVDGMGRTERFYRLLGSRSLVFKQTMHREWHDDRLVPWVHYVPVSLGMEELPELLRWFAGGVGGEAGEGGREKRGRVLLEYARLVGEERDGERVCPWGRSMGD